MRHDLVGGLSDGGRNTFDVVHEGAYPVPSAVGAHSVCFVGLGAACFIGTKPTGALPVVVDAALAYTADHVGGVGAPVAWGADWRINEAEHAVADGAPTRR